MGEMSLSDIAKLAAEIAATTAIETVEKREREKLKKRHDWRQRNTKLLLKNYRMFVEHSEEIKLSPLESAEALEDLYTEEFTVESIRRSKQRTLAMVKFIQDMLDRYRIICERSGHDEDMRRFKVIHAIYISEQNLTVEDIAKCHNVDVRTVYRDINDAAKTLSVLIFGVDAIRFE